MKALKTLLATAAFGSALAVSAAANATIFIGISHDGGLIQTVATDPTNTLASFSSLAAFGAFTVNDIGATGDLLLPDLLNSHSLNTSTSAAGGFLDVYVLETDLPAPTGANGFISSMTSNVLTGGLTFTGSTFVDATNSGVYAAGVNISGPTTFTADGGTAKIGSLTPVGPGSYSITEHYHIFAPGAGNANTTIDVFAIPEPTTWALMIMGFGGVGAMVRSRRRQAAFA
jgi:hypothetical protein